MPQAKTEGKLPDITETFGKLFKNKKYVLGVGSQVLYVGAQIMCWTYIYQYAEAINILAEEAANYQFIAFILFLAGRAVGTFLLRSIRPGSLLTIFSILAGVAALGVIFIQGIAGLYCLVAISLFTSILFPTIYGIALGGLRNDEAKIGAAGLVMAILRGALMPCSRE